MLFGHQANDNNASQIPDDMVSDAAVQDVTASTVNPLAVDSATGASVPATTDDNTTTQTSDVPVFGTVAPEKPAVEDALSDETAPEEPQAESIPSPTSLEVEAPVTAEGSTDLLALKQQALGELTPLVDHLEQSPEEKFRTTMMMIQSTDNQALLKEAYDAAQAIPDDKVRAQALLDVINEINYFTQPKK